MICDYQNSKKKTLIIIRESTLHLPFLLFSCHRIVAKTLLPSITESSFPFQIRSPWGKSSNMQNTALNMEVEKHSLTTRQGEFDHLVNPKFHCSTDFPILLHATLSTRHSQGSLQSKAALYTFLQSPCQFLLALDVD